MKKDLTLFEELKNNEVRIKANREAAYMAYGRFAIEFEILANSIRFCMKFCLDKFGLRDTNAAEILLADLTMASTVIKCKALVIEYFKGKKGGPEIIKHLEPLFKNSVQIYELRNKVIHGTWHVPDFSRVLTGDFVTINGRKVSTKAKGIKEETFSLSVEDFDSWSETVSYAIDAYTNLASTFFNNAEIRDVLSADRIAKTKLQNPLRSN